LRDLLISSLQNAKVFIITDNAERADATLRGTAEDKAYNETFQSSEGVNSRSATSVNNPANRANAPRRGVYVGGGAGEHESVRTSERKHEAVVAVRLVSRDGDVLWSTTQESQGAKFRGAGADVAEKVTKKLVEDLDRVRKPPKTTSAPQLPER